jgi:hypothetical protein
MRTEKVEDKITYRIPRIFIFIVLILVIIAIWIIGFLSGLLSVNDILLNFLGFISMLISITMLAIVGAIFLGMYIGHRALTRRGFTPFEISMLEMHEDIKSIKKRIAKLENELNNDKAPKNMK